MPNGNLAVTLAYLHICAYLYLSYCDITRSRREATVPTSDPAPNTGVPDPLHRKKHTGKDYIVKLISYRNYRLTSETIYTAYGRGELINEIDRRKRSLLAYTEI